MTDWTEYFVALGWEVVRRGSTLRLSKKVGRKTFSETWRIEGMRALCLASSNRNK